MVFKEITLIVPLFFTGCGICYDNFHRISSSNAYRSAQLSAEGLEQRIKQHSLRSVVNLRGYSSKQWHKDEEAVCKQNGVVLYDVKTSAGRIPKSEEIETLLEVFDNGPHPMLIHCIGGADRTGLAGAIYRIHKLGHKVRCADDELSIFYGHLALRGIGTPDLDEFLVLYEQSGAENLGAFARLLGK